MRTYSIRLGGRYCQMKELSCEQMIESLNRCEALFQSYWLPDLNPDLLRAMCENAVLGFESLYQEGERVFSSPEEVLKTLTLSELADIFDVYDAALSKERIYQTLIEAEEGEE